MEDKIKDLEKEVSDLKDQVKKINEKLFPFIPETDITGARISNGSRII